MVSFVVIWIPVCRIQIRKTFLEIPKHKRNYEAEIFMKNIRFVTDTDSSHPLQEKR